MDECVYWLWLVLVFGPAEKRIWILSSKFYTAESFYYALRSHSVPGVTAAETNKIYTVGLDAAEKIISCCREKGIDVICYEDEKYPEKLRGIPNPPAVLFVKGSLDLLETSFVVDIAGSRSPSDYSEKVTEMLAHRLCEKGCVIASGLSDGIDTLAVDAALEKGAPVLGIYGLAIDQYDAEKAARIIENGALISEICSEMNCPRPKFTNRNRLITALSDSVVFVEGSVISRGLDLCMQCISHGKLLFVVPPHDITDRRYKGQSWLIRRGCRPVFSEKDILFHLSYLGIDRLEYTPPEDEYSDIGDYSFFVDESPDENETAKKNSAVKPRKDVPESEAEPSEEPDISALDEKEKAIYELLRDKPMLADEIAAELGTDITETLSVLTMLEFEGYIASMSGKRFGLI